MEVPALPARLDEGDEATPAGDERVALGQEIRKLRKARGKPLADLAHAIGRSVSFISQLERGRAEASIGDLKGVAHALGVPVGWFFIPDDIPGDELGRIVRAGSRRQLGTGNDGFMEELLSPDIGGAFETFLSTFSPGSSLERTEMRDTEEEGYVVQGTLDVWIAEHAFQVSVGDSFRIAREPFRWANRSNTDVVVVWVIAPPSY
jgi:transcriptional regulator with XRE-family HTH domain